MKAARIHNFGSPEAVIIDELPRPTPRAGQLLVRVSAAGVGPWDAIIREGNSKVSPQPPLILGSDLSGIVEAVGPEVSEFKTGDEVYGVTNPQFCGASAEYALAEAKMMAHKPERLTYVEAASVPVVAVTAWQMLFEYAHVTAGQSVLVLGAAGNVGAYAVQLAHGAGLHVTATAGAADLAYVRSLGADRALDYRTGKIDEVASPVDVVLDLVGGETQERSFRILKPGGILVSVVSLPSASARTDVRSVFFYVDVTTARLNRISELLKSGEVTTQVGTVLPLKDARVAHEMLAGAPHKRGKIVLTMAA